MSTVTLEQLQSEHQRLGALIAQFTEQKVKPEARTIDIEEVQIELEPGEHYAGLVLEADGTPAYHLVLLPGEAENVTWGAAINWADQAGGSLPSRQEQALLYANCKAQFQAAWYWSKEEHSTEGSCAWYQFFDSGFQGDDLKSYEGRARAVRRFAA